MGLMTLGLVAVLAAFVLGEAVNSRAGAYLDLMFYVGVVMCAVGAAVFTVRVMLANRRR